MIRRAQAGDSEVSGRWSQESRRRPTVNDRPTMLPHRARVASVDRPWRTAGIVCFGVSALLLLSYGGAILAAPVTLPLMFAAALHHPTTAFRRAAACLGALTAAEVAWAITYVSVADTKPWIWLVPLLSSLAVGLFFVARTGGARRDSPATAGW